ncbi:cd7 antigen-like [Dunckerocampus dactyliophorus]|uniref:cd7 antigen-like n=1 Tax=Dunckerocampus dactyliophorus TaxID=161453 RepID=UPI002405D0E0|nr:cd7 antigen-like [Dunckerocampus dactyliophorus]
MTGIRHLWTLLVIDSVFVCGDIQFLERQEGEGVVFPCSIKPRSPSPLAFCLRRTWLHLNDVLFKYTNTEAHVYNAPDKRRLMVSGDPSSHSVNVTLSDLRANDTDRYVCKFVVENPSSEDEYRPGETEFFLLVNNDDTSNGWVDIGQLEVCTGGSAVIPCLPPHGEDLPVEGVSLTRQRGRGPVELLYHSKHHHRNGPPSSSRFQLSSAPGPGGFTYNLTLRQLQPEDGGLYSCQLLLRGRHDSSTSLDRRRAVFVSVEGQCSCSSYSTLLYALTSSVVVLVVLLASLLLYQKKTCGGSSGSKPRPPAPIYEEMVGVQPLSGKLAPQHLEEPSEYGNCRVKKPCPENHYETPIGGLRK